jgi:spore coat polysaccharide biosynthesis protein SpsF
MHKFGIVTQARMTSTRLPGKVLLRVNGRSLLEYHLDRLAAAGVPICVATTTNLTDDPIVEECNRLRVPYFRGSENDVLSRFVGAVEQEAYENVIRVTSDCPLVDGSLINAAINEYSKFMPSDDIYYSNCLERTFPRGMDFEIFSRNLLQRAHIDATNPSQREHVTQFLYINLKSELKFIHFKSGQDNSDLRLTVDESADFLLVKTLIENYSAEKLSCGDIINIIRGNPELSQINSHIRQK